MRFSNAGSTARTVAQQSEARLRAERRAGAVLNEVLEAGVRQGATAAFAELLKPHGVTRHQADRWQRLAYLPLDAFERKIVKRVALAVAG